ncbi:MAG: hypothetical protein AB8G05_26265 [Oligoflexales bacterium]
MKLHGGFATKANQIESSHKALFDKRGMEVYLRTVVIQMDHAVIHV